MPNCKKTLKGWLAVITGLLSLIWINTACAQGFIVRSVDTRLNNKVYSLSAQIEYQLTPQVKEALQNGVPIVIAIDIKVEKERTWWLNKTVAELKQGYMLLRHSLSDKYILNNLNSGVQKDFVRIEDAIEALGHVEALPIIDAKLVDSGSHYRVLMRTYLDIEALPAQVRPLAYLSSPWRLESEWYQWPLQN